MKRLLFPLLLTWTLAVAGSADAASSPLLKITSNGETISRLIIGDHLEVALDKGDPDELYEYRLIDSDYYEIATGSTVADAAGRVPPTLLWAHTGVVGCDYPPFVPGEYRFQNFADAEEMLHLRTLKIQVLASSGVEVASQNITLLAVNRELAYFSDAAGCLRRRFGNSESVYLSLLHPSRTTPTRRFFLVSGSNPAIGDNIVDVRDAVSIFSIPPTGDPVTFLAWSGAASTIGFYSGILRWQSSSTPIVTGSDARLSPHPHPGFLPTPPGGLVITIDGCPSCDP